MERTLSAVRESSPGNWGSITERRKPKIVKAIIAGSKKINTKSVQPRRRLAAAPPRQAGGRLQGPTAHDVQFTMKLTERATERRDRSVPGGILKCQVIDILTRAAQNNPLLAGEAGRRQDRGGRSSPYKSSPARYRRRGAGHAPTTSTSAVHGAGVTGELENSC